MAEKLLLIVGGNSGDQRIRRIVQSIGFSVADIWSPIVAMRKSHLPTSALVLTDLITHGTARGLYDPPGAESFPAHPGHNYTITEVRKGVFSLQATRHKADGLEEGLRHLFDLVPAIEIKKIPSPEPGTRRKPTMRACASPSCRQCGGWFGVDAATRICSACHEKNEMISRLGGNLELYKAIRAVQAVQDSGMMIQIGERIDVFFEATFEPKPEPEPEPKQKRPGPWTTDVCVVCGVEKKVYRKSCKCKPCNDSGAAPKLVVELIHLRNPKKGKAHAFRVNDEEWEKISLCGRASWHNDWEISEDESEFCGVCNAHPDNS